MASTIHLGESNTAVSFQRLMPFALALFVGMFEYLHELCHLLPRDMTLHLWHELHRMCILISILLSRSKLRFIAVRTLAK